MDINIDKILGSTIISPIKNDDIQCLIQELDILMNTTPSDVFNASKEFINLPYYVFKTKKQSQNLEADLKSLISSTINIPSGINVDVAVTFIKGEQSDIGLIGIEITDNRTSTDDSKIYKKLYTYV